MAASLISVVSSSVAATLASACVGSGITVTGTPTRGGNSVACGTYSGGIAALITASYGASPDLPNLDSGVVLCTGRAADAAAFATGESLPSTDFGLVGVSGDSTTLTFQFIPAGPTLTIPFIFASKEYPEWNPAVFGDFMTITLDGTNIALVPVTGDQIGVGSVNSTENSTYYQANPVGSHNYGFVYDAFVKIALTQTVTPGQNLYPRHQHPGHRGWTSRLSGVYRHHHRARSHDG
jgi:hypothetical protein